jgi:hypothetical protein
MCEVGSTVNNLGGCPPSWPSGHEGQVRGGGWWARFNIIQGKEVR